MCPYEGRVEEILTNDCPYRWAQGVALGISPYDTLIVAEHLVAYVPLMNLALPVADHFFYMCFHDVEQLLAGPVLIVLGTVG